jgi:hypothetical protein
MLIINALHLEIMIVAAVIGLVSVVASGAFGVAQQNKQKELMDWSKVPNWLSPADFYEKDNTLNYALLLIGIIAIGLIVAIVLKK